MQVTTCKLVKLKQSRQNQHTTSRKRSMQRGRRKQGRRGTGNREQVQVLGENELCMCSSRSSSSRYSLAGRAKRENVIRAN